MKLLCPVCKKELIKEERRYYCQNNHSFDIAKEGYVNLYRGSAKVSGDSKESIKARETFLNKEYYHFLKEEMASIAKAFHITSMVDLACGEGYYTKDIPVDDKIGIDLSKKGLKIASKKDKNTTYILSSIFNTPLKDESSEMVMTCFAPIAEKEIVRILKKDGIFLLISPARDHMWELKKTLYDTPYENKEEEKEIPGLSLIKHYTIKEQVDLHHEDLMSLFEMTPYFYKTSLKDKAKLDAVDQLKMTFAFDIQLFQKNCPEQ